MKHRQKERCLYSFSPSSFVLWYTLLLLTWPKHPGRLIYESSPQGLKPSPAGALLREDSKISARFVVEVEISFPPISYSVHLATNSSLSAFSDGYGGGGGGGEGGVKVHLVWKRLVWWFWRSLSSSSFCPWQDFHEAHLWSTVRGKPYFMFI